MAAAMTTVTLGAPAANGQSIYQPANAADAYGNRGPLDLSRRELGVYQNDYQQRVLTGYLNAGRRINRRGGAVPFSLPSDAIRQRTNSAGGLALFRSAPPRATRPSARALSLYGGFGDRSSLARPGTAATALRRRAALIAATALNAPIRRAGRTSGMRLGFGSRLTPFSERGLPSFPTPAEDEPEAAVDLTEHLRDFGQAVGDRARAEAWRLFRDGDYRQAARAFARTASLQPFDAEPRVGELFCYAAVGALRTSMAVMEQWQRRDENLFLHRIDMKEAFADPRIPFDLRVELRLVASGEDVDADLKALYVVVLWYLSDFDEAIRVARELAGAAPTAPYADWPAKMERARRLLGGEPAQP